jgi:ribosomal protein S15P/S13E
MQISKVPTESFQKQIQSTIHKCNQQKYLLQIKPMAPKLNALIKTHKEDKSIRPAINNIQAPSYKLVKYLSKTLNQLIKLPYTYTTRNSTEVAQI